MRAITISLVTIIAAAALYAQQPAPPTKTFTSAAEVAGLLAKAKAEYRTGVGPAAVHEKEAEMFYVLDGSATLTTGGKLTEEKRTNAENLTGTGIEGGTAQAVAKGDVIIVPENTPHWFNSINGTIVLMSLHVPRSMSAGTH
jgi:quercetin dioxygenase-like cupin family protein